ncbi:MAG: 50S ribosomal protein L32 [candidate division WOR-3 bacterium]
MPVPKRRHSHSRKNKRRSQFKMKSIQYIECPKCHNPKLPHRVCPVCGTYKDILIIASKEEKS